MATGCFGRGELYPYSDLDLAVVSSETVSDDLQEKIAAFVQALWDMKLSPSVKSGSVDELCESVRNDITGDTAFLEARFLFGNRQTADELTEKMNAQRNVAAFIEAKLVEMEHRHAKSQGSGAVLEPNIKSCPGGLRDIHTLRLGMEILPTRNISVRFGYNFVSSPFAKNAYLNMLTNGQTRRYSTAPDYINYGNTHRFTFGWGYHTTNFYFDAALLYQRQYAEFYPFHYNSDITSAVNEVPGYELNLRRATCTFTLGFRF